MWVRESQANGPVKEESARQVFRVCEDGWRVGLLYDCDSAGSEMREVQKSFL